jgi:hypothetical protein
MIEYHYDGGSVAPIHLEDNTWNPEHRLVREVVCSPYRDGKGPLSAIALGDVDAPQRLRIPERVVGKGIDHSSSGFWCFENQFIYSRRMFSSIDLCYSPDTCGSIRVASEHEFLERAHLLQVAQMSRPKDAMS